MDNELQKSGNFILFTTPDGDVKLEVFLRDETLWLTQKMMAELFGVDARTINEHIKNIFKSGELDEISTIRKIRIVQREGEREVEREVAFYNLDAIIAVGYRVNSKRATQFRIWATKVLREYVIKGFAIDDERLKQGERFFGKDYFKELLERVRSIRASERRIYQQITDIFAECKYWKEKVGLNVLDGLKEKARYVESKIDFQRSFFAVFSKSGFTAELTELSKKDENILLYSLDEMF